MHCIQASHPWKSKWVPKCLSSMYHAIFLYCCSGREVCIEQTLVSWCWIAYIARYIYGPDIICSRWFYSFCKYWKVLISGWLQKLVARFACWVWYIIFDPWSTSSISVCLVPRQLNNHGWKHCRRATFCCLVILVNNTSVSLIPCKCYAIS